MKILVTGARTFRNRLVVARAFDDAAVNAAVHGGPVVVIHGGAAGSDSLCELEARKRGWHTAVVRAMWSFYGKGPAGHIRNDVMVYLGAHKALAFTMPCEDRLCENPRPHITHGTASCMERMRLAGMRPREYKDENLDVG